MAALWQLLLIYKWDGSTYIIFSDLGKKDIKITFLTSDMTPEQENNLDRFNKILSYIQGHKLASKTPGPNGYSLRWKASKIKDTNNSFDT